MRNVVYGASGSSRRTPAASSDVVSWSSTFLRESDMRQLKETRLCLEPPPPVLRVIRAAVIALVLAAPSPAHGQRTELEKRIVRTTLANGLEVIVVPNPGVPLVTIEADVKNGSFTQTP